MVYQGATGLYHLLINVIPFISNSVRVRRNYLVREFHMEGAVQPNDIYDNNLYYSPHINNMICTAISFLYNIRKSSYKLRGECSNIDMHVISTP